ncbi:hypothetical protein GCM10025795_24900 [Verticiella sediminum]
MADDGAVGPVTLAAIQAMTSTDVLMRFNAERLAFYTKLTTWPTFGRGWTRLIPVAKTERCVPTIALGTATSPLQNGAERIRGA